jgi:hypothetical protein
MSEVAYIATFLADHSRETGRQQALSGTQQCRKWQRPQLGEPKLSSDGAFDGGRKEAGWGFAIRDDSGRVLKSGAGREDFLPDPFHAELLGCLAGLRAAADTGITHLVVETHATLDKTTLEV